MVDGPIICSLVFSVLMVKHQRLNFELLFSHFATNEGYCYVEELYI